VNIVCVVPFDILTVVILCLLCHSCYLMLAQICTRSVVYLDVSNPAETRFVN